MNSNNDNNNYVPLEETCFLCHRDKELSEMQFFPFVKHGICSSCWSNYIKYGHRIKQLKQEED